MTSNTENLFTAILILSFRKKNGHRFFLISFISLDNACSNGLYMNMFDYCRQLLGKLNHIVEDLKPVLITLHTPVEDGGLLNNINEL
jgi:hypothetical protein